jgi:integrase
MGRPKLGYQLRRDRGDRCYLRVDGYAEKFAFDTRNPTRAQVADAVAFIKSNGKAEASKVPTAERDTLRALADAYYGSKQFLLDIGSVTQTARRNAIEALLRTLTPEGRRPRAQVKVYDLTRRHIIGIRDECLNVPETGNIRVKVLRYLYAYALDVEWPGVIANPARDVDLLPPKVKRTPTGNAYTGHREWELAEVERFLDFYRDDADAWLTVSLLLYTGVRVSDAIKLGKGMETMLHFRGVRVPGLKFKVTKGAEKRARRGKEQVEANVPLIPQFVDALKKANPDALVYLLNEHGRAWGSAKSLGNRMRKWCNAITDQDAEGNIVRPFDGLSCHGLRKASADWWAKTYRCRTQDLMAIFGWLTEKEALHYTEGYDREDAAAGMVVQFPQRGAA